MIDDDTTVSEYTYTGKRLDPENGLYHFHFQQYDPGAGIWTTPDPIGILGGVNLYGYALNNPVNLKDWLGLHTGGNDGPGSDPEGNENADGSFSEAGNPSPDATGAFNDYWGRDEAAPRRTDITYLDITNPKIIRDVPSLVQSALNQIGGAQMLDTLQKLSTVAAAATVETSLPAAVFAAISALAWGLKTSVYSVTDSF